MLATRLPRMIAVLIVCVVAWSTDGSGQEPAEGRSALREVRRSSADVFTLEVEVDRPASLPGQGIATWVMRFTVDKDVTAVVWKASLLPDPKYYSPDTNGYQPVDYDAEGNLIVSMWSEGAMTHDQTICEGYRESTGFRVAPDGRTKRRLNSGALLVRRPPSNCNMETLGLLQRILWALGRPWTDSLGEVASEDADPDGTRRVRAVGWWIGTSGSGVCELLIDPSNGYLVRRASFGAEGEAPRAECRSEGTRRFGDVTLAQRGEFVLRSETISVRLISFSPRLDPNVIAEARKIIARAQTRMVRVLDYRDDPTKPKVRLVPAGDLDKDE